MTASRDTNRFIRDFLAEGQTELPERVYDAVRSDIDRTRQRVVIAPWKAPGMNTFAKFAIAAAAVVVVAIVGISLPPARDGASGASVLPPTTSSPAPQPTSSPAAADVPRSSAGYPAGGVAIGMHGVTVDGIRLSFILPGSGWEGHEHYLSKSTKGPQGAEAIIFWTTFPGGDNYIPCMDLLSSAGPSVADLAAAVSTVPGTDLVSGPTDVTVGGRPAKHVSLFVTYSVLDNSSVCYPGFFFSWTPDDEGAMWDSTLPGDTIRVWMVDVDGARLFIEAETHFNAGPDVELEIQQIVDSIAFE
jgi:hypothetical protein